MENQDFWHVGIFRNPLDSCLDVKSDRKRASKSVRPEKVLKAAQGRAKKAKSADP